MGKNGVREKFSTPNAAVFSQFLRKHPVFAEGVLPPGGRGSG
jgi:hypothetical protein